MKLNDLRRNTRNALQGERHGTDERIQYLNMLFFSVNELYLVWFDPFRRDMPNEDGAKCWIKTF